MSVHYHFSPLHSSWSLSLETTFVFMRLYLYLRRSDTIVYLFLSMPWQTEHIETCVSTAVILRAWSWACAYGRKFLGVHSGVKLVQIASLLPSRLGIGMDGDPHRLLSSRAVLLFRLVCIVTKNSCRHRHVRLSACISADPNAPWNLAVG
jgi:hypothetical protein